jgi:hypothetical protein
MGGVDRLKNIGGHVKVEQAFKTTYAGAGAITGTGIDRQDYSSCVFSIQCGDAVGSPTAQTVDGKLQECATLGGTYTDVTGLTTAQLTGDEELATKDVNLQPLQRFVRVVCTVALTAGSTPKLAVNGQIVFGGGRTDPI